MVPWSTQTRFSRVDYRVVVEAAAVAMTQDRLLCGTSNVARKFPEVRGRSCASSVRYLGGGQV